METTSLLNDGLAFPDKKALEIDEQWKDIPGFENLYQASTQGRIRSKERKVTSNARYPCRVWKQRILKQKYRDRKTGTGKDARVVLWKDGHPQTFLVSRLIAMTWCDGYDSKLTVNHIDGNPTNNNSDNLEWISRSDNIRKAFAAHLYSNQHPVSLIDSNGNRIYFYSMSMASRYIGKSTKYISDLLLRGITTTNDGYTIVDESVTKKGAPT